MGTALFPDKIFAREACSMGMIWEAASDEKFASHWLHRTAHLAAGPTLNYKYVKIAIRSSFSNSEADQLVLRATLPEDCGQALDFNKGITEMSKKAQTKC